MEKPNVCTELNKESCGNFEDTPTEILVELLNSVMLNDDEKAIRYCNEVLTYEPENSTVKEFLRLISEKLEIAKNEELGNSYDSGDSISSASDSDSSHQETDKKNSSSSSSESNSSSEESNDKENSKPKTSAFESLNLITTQREPKSFKKQNASQNQEKKTLTKKGPNKSSSYPCARALSTSRPIQEPSKADGKPKMNYKESSSQKADVKKIENLSHLPGIVS